MINITVARILFFVGYSTALSLIELGRALIKKEDYNFTAVCSGVSSALACALLMP